MGAAPPLLITFLFLQTSCILVASAVLQSHIERRLLANSEEFISLDCGLAEMAGPYNYTPNGLNYTSDEKYISSGNPSTVSPTFSNLTSYDGHYLFNTVRSFPEGQRNCYHLKPVKPSNKYLIRVRFMYGNYDRKHSIPAFGVYIGVNFWLNVSLANDGSKTFSEIIHVATADSIDVCLLNTGQGTPFISALELRPLGNSAYSASRSFSLVNIVHDDTAGTVPSADNSTKSEVMGDAYDRIWHSSSIWHGKIINSMNTSLLQANSPYEVPASVLMTASEQDDGNPRWEGRTTMNERPDQIYVYWHFTELESLGPDDTREFNLYVTNVTNIPAGYKFGPIRPNHMQVTTIASNRIPNSGSKFLHQAFERTSGSNKNPILNAMEVFRVLELPASPTVQEDVDAITAIKDTYAIQKVWQGDPCLPVDYQWDGLNCTYDGNNPPRINSLILNSCNLTGDIPPSLANLTTLKYLNLSDNGLTGKIPDFLADMPSLKTIDLSENSLTGPVPCVLVKMEKKEIITLRLTGNPNVYKSYPCGGKKYKFILLMVMIAVTVSVIIGTILFLAIKRRKKPEAVVADRTVKLRNQRFNYSDINRITDSFKKILGRGGFGTVYYGLLQDGTKVAVKLLNNLPSTITVRQFCAEAELLMRIHHVNLVSLIGYCDEHAHMALVYEYMSSGDLQMHLSERNERPLSWKRRLQVSVDAAQGLEYLHSGCQPPVVHRDVKPANILLDETGHAKIADFGLCRYCPTDSQGASMTNVAGTRGYLDPEYCQLHTLSEKSDVYGFGIVLLQLLTGQPTFIKPLNGHEDDLPTYILNWVSPVVESGDILTIVDNRIRGDLNIGSSAMKFFEIAMECVKPTGKERPRMSEVVADLKLCYASEGFDDQIGLPSVNSGNHNPHPSLEMVLDCSLTSLLPR